MTKNFFQRRPVSWRRYALTDFYVGLLLMKKLGIDILKMLLWKILQSYKKAVVSKPVFFSIKLQVYEKNRPEHIYVPLNLWNISEIAYSGLYLNSISFEKSIRCYYLWFRKMWNVSSLQIAWIFQTCCFQNWWTNNLHTEISISKISMVDFCLEYDLFTT